MDGKQVGHMPSSDTITIVVDGIKNVGMRKPVSPDTIGSKLEDVDTFRTRYQNQSANHYAGK
jgi:hypothetical protein